MSGLPPFATVERTSAFGSFVPFPDSCTAATKVYSITSCASGADEHSHGSMLINNSCGRRDNFRWSPRGHFDAVSEHSVINCHFITSSPGKTDARGRSASTGRAEKVNVVKTRQANNQPNRVWMLPSAPRPSRPAPPSAMESGNT
jgi:hypothetical protein